MTAKVNHSQKLREKPLMSWVICEVSGKAVSCHCNCIAGLGESCSHVAYLLWAIEAGVQLRDSLTVTQKKAYWVLPNSRKDVPYVPSSSTTYSSLTSSIFPDVTSLPCSSSLTPPHHNVSATLSQSDGSASFPSPKQPSKTINPPTDAEIQKLYSSLAKCKSKPAILSLTRDYSSSYIPLSLSPDLPSPLSALYNTEYLSSNYTDLLSLAEDLEISITEGQCLAVEKSTKTQFQSRIWYNMRAGRITALRLRAVCAADEAIPPMSLIMSICYPDDEARQRYSLQLNSTHDGLTITKSGLFINHASPFLGASPNALVDCLCCGSGICEIKCPYCHRDDTIEESVADKSFCLEATEGKAYQLKKFTCITTRLDIRGHFCGKNFPKY
uniref:SWIM-type domain-containing protein n=1 Tax=Amphimedon queenslandica TaxID=400682 RepID=A0A1X7UTK9_AMPQE